MSQYTDWLVVGAIDVTRFVHLLNIDGTDATGKTITGFDLTYCRDLALPATKVDATALAAVDSVHADNKMIEVDATNMPGVYRVDWPDAPFAVAPSASDQRHARYAVLTIKEATIQTHSEVVQLYFPPGLLYRGPLSADDENSALLNVDGSGDWGVVHSNGALAILRANDAPHATEVRHVVQADSVNDKIYLDSETSLDIFNHGGEGDLLAVPDGAFVGQNPLIMFDGTVIAGGVVSQTEFQIGDGPPATIDNVYKGHLVLLKRANAAERGLAPWNTTMSLRLCTQYTAATKVIKINRAPDFTLVAGSGTNGTHVSIIAGLISETFDTGLAVAGTLSTTRMTTDLAEATDNHYNGRLVLWTSGALRSQARAIKDYQGSNKMLSYAASTEAPAAGDAFVIV